jgi:hypothetical protein
VTKTSNPTFRQFFDAVLDGMSVPKTGQVRTAARRALAVLAIFEGAQVASAAGRFNPLNCVVPAGDSADYNTTHVQNYRTPEQGVQGTLWTLTGQRSTSCGVPAALRSSTNRTKILNAFAEYYRSWGDTTSPARFLAISNAPDGNARALALLNATMP